MLNLSEGSCSAHREIETEEVGDRARDGQQNDVCGCVFKRDVFLFFFQTCKL